MPARNRCKYVASRSTLLAITIAPRTGLQIIVEPNIHAVLAHVRVIEAMNASTTDRTIIHVVRQYILASSRPTGKGRPEYLFKGDSER